MRRRMSPEAREGFERLVQELTAKNQREKRSAMSETFHTTGTGPNRRGVLDDARTKGAAWFEVNPQCLRLTIRGVDEEVATTIGGQVDACTYVGGVDVDIEHQYEAKTYGPAKCRGCGKENWG